MADPAAIKKNVAKAKADLEKTKIPALNKKLKAKKDQLSAEKDPSMKSAVRAEIKYIQEQIKAARAGVPLNEDRSMNILEKIDRHLGRKRVLNEGSPVGGVWVVAGHSQKQDGLLFVCKASDAEDAYETLVQSMRGYKIVEWENYGEKELALVEEGIEPDDIHPDGPGHEGWSIYASQIGQDGFGEASW